ncbi:DinB family protein [Mucilaginibacter sp. BT774]|uniref:DinB family protein n=1 Tax=Mucilaginibacter sp. BT774 TaxID=3062276 RepID=UPI002676F23A|nr:DinB family protein [Mucilaginibacter sp. BT774]MDO3625149.1 DinB family protein [Mucilaginibacter sp. BT774]
MKDYFIRLLHYDRYANLRILAALLQTEDRTKAEQLMAHLLIAQQVWLGRCIGKPASVTTLWPDWKANTFEQIINDNHSQWLTFLVGASNNDFEQSIYYKNLQGDTFETRLSDILTHLINHGTHHRAQVGQHLKLVGIGLPGTDYILFAREH